mmetsp:Transcript_14545/g.20345  ORF Transcript_14545/g.20345 Transcript_14545/m.20345 type:complete len:87 (-) Transcript_14545:138-398(-)
MKSSMAVNGCRRVVGVVGRGHMQGVLKALSENHSGKFKTLTSTRRRKAMKEKVLGMPKPVAQRLTFDIVIGGLGWLLYEWWVKAHS